MRPCLQLLVSAHMHRVRLRRAGTTQGQARRSAAGRRQVHDMLWSDLA